MSITGLLLLQFERRRLLSEMAEVSAAVDIYREAIDSGGGEKVEAAKEKVITAACRLDDFFCGRRK